jgi:dipeptidase E
VAGARRKLAFVPFAAVSLSNEDYTAKVREALAPAGFLVELLRQPGDLENADLVLVGGGNTFQLLQQVRSRGLLAPIAARVRAGTPYIGWSAGANLACPTIKTTNDMPIVDPGGLDALGLVRFQINPHYTNAHPPGHHGETRDQRLAEFALANPALPVIGLPEGDWLRVAGESVELHGPHDAVAFLGAGAPATVKPGPVSF